jgi:hypothetical protein
MGVSPPNRHKFKSRNVQPNVSIHQESLIDPPCIHDTCQTDPDLARIVAAWPGLPEAIKAGIVAMVKAAGK